jgi:hypothetical protein
MKEFLDELFIPGRFKEPSRSPNKFKKGYLKKSMWSRREDSNNTPHQGKKECARRLRQMEKRNAKG